MTTTKYDLAYGRQGGRIVPWVAGDVDLPRCTVSGCGRISLAASPDYCSEHVVAATEQPGLFDE